MVNNCEGVLCNHDLVPQNGILSTSCRSHRKVRPCPHVWKRCLSTNAAQTFTTQDDIHGRQWMKNASWCYERNLHDGSTEFKMSHDWYPPLTGNPQNTDLKRRDLILIKKSGSSFNIWCEIQAKSSHCEENSEGSFWCTRPNWENEKSICSTCVI